MRTQESYQTIHGLLGNSLGGKTTANRVHELQEIFAATQKQLKKSIETMENNTSQESRLYRQLFKDTNPDLVSMQSNSMERERDSEVAYKSATKINMNLNSQNTLKRDNTASKKERLRGSFKPINRPKIKIS